MIITSNIWHTGNRANTTIILDTTLGEFNSLVDSVVEDNEAGARHTCVLCTTCCFSPRWNH
jgi:hypothetical protein